METVCTPDQMRRADLATIEAGTPATELMDRAAYACAVVVRRMLGTTYGRRVVIVCGPGNNGGDGIACGRHLGHAGVAVTVVLLAAPTGTAAHHLEIAQRLGPRSMRIAGWDAARAAGRLDRADLIVDAVFGTGFGGSRAPEGVAAEAITAMDRSPAPVVAVDIASGVDGSDGSVPGPAVRATATVAIQSLKTGHVVLPGAEHAGRCWVADVGIGPVASELAVPTRADVAAVLPSRAVDAHKYSAGTVGLLVGSPGLTGAAILTAAAAARTGAGMVLAGVPRTSLEVIEEGVVAAAKIGLPDVEGHLDAKSVDEFAPHAERCDAIAIGPGLGRTPGVVAALRRALRFDVPMVIDADGLWALAEIVSDEPDALRHRGAPTVLTPHAGEFQRLGGDGSDRVAAVRGLAARLGAVVHLKGPRALTASPAGEVVVNPTGDASLATGGSGDALTGVVVALLAQGLGPLEATWAGAYVHGACCGFAPSHVATDIVDRLPHVLRSIGIPTTRTRPRPVLDALR